MRTILLAVWMIFILAACGSGGSSPSDDNNPGTAGSGGSLDPDTGGSGGVDGDGGAGGDTNIGGNGGEIGDGGQGGVGGDVQIGGAGGTIDPPGPTCAELKSDNGNMSDDSPCLIEGTWHGADSPSRRANITVKIIQSSFEVNLDGDNLPFWGTFEAQSLPVESTDNYDGHDYRLVIALDAEGHLALMSFTDGVPDLEAPVLFVRD